MCGSCRDILTAAVILDGVLHVAVLIVAQAQPLTVAVVLREGSEQRCLGAVVLPTDHVIFAIFGFPASMSQTFQLRRTETVDWCSEVTAQASRSVVEILHARRVSDADAVGVRRALLALRWNEPKEKHFPLQ